MVHIFKSQVYVHSEPTLSAAESWVNAQPEPVTEFQIVES